MADPKTTSSPEIHCVFVETSLDTRLALPLHKDEIISDFKEKLRNEHQQVFSEIGEINVSALKVKRRNKFYHFSDSMSVWKAFDGITRDWFIYVDGIRVMSGDQNGSNVEKKKKKKKKEIDVGSVLVDGMDTKDLTLEESLELKVVDKKTRKRRIRSTDVKTSRKKSKADVNQSAVATTTELSGKVKGEVASQFCVVSPSERVDDILTGAIGKDIESGEKNGIEIQQTTDAVMLSEGRILTVIPELVDGLSKGEVNDVLHDNQTVKEALEKVDDLIGATEQDFEKGGENAEIVMINQEKDLQLASELVDGEITSRDDDNLQTGENQLEKKRKRTKSSKHHITIDCADAISKSCPISERETLGNPLVEAVQKETDMGEKSVEDVTTTPVTEKKKRRKKILNDHINQPAAATTTATASRETVNEINIVPRNVDRVDATSAATTTTATASRETVNEINIVPGNVDRVDATSAAATAIESYPISRRGNLGKENEMGEKMNEDVVYESKMPDENTSHEHEVIKEDVEMDADQAKSVKSTKKKTSKRAKTPTKEAPLVDSQNVEPIVAVDGEEPENVIRNVLDSLQQKKEESGKKSSKRWKKKDSLKTMQEEAQAFSVQEEASPINNPKDTDASSTLAKKDTEDDASHLKTSIEVASDLVGDDNKQDQVTGGTKSRNEKIPSGSVDPSNVSVKGHVKNKKQVVKKSSNKATVNNNKKEAVEKKQGNNLAEGTNKYVTG